MNYNVYGNTRADGRLDYLVLLNIDTNHGEYLDFTRLKWIKILCEFEEIYHDLYLYNISRDEYDFIKRYPEIFLA